ncbi:MAG TPA: bifunctional oligoribonuclease/PAP phosphatase NrnA [Bacteroidia bacterium]|jgi:phosphoesterase RecJ-like protein|nr:bifunctional oligoribonuclease/PAP phosphatase NrnA [Bacteroidia bacterium]
MNTKELKQFKKELSRPRNIVIITHWSPDGDAIGSSLGFYHYLLQKKHKVTVITPNEYPSFLNWMKGNKQVIDFSADRPKAEKKLNQAELIFCLDFNSLKRIDALGPLVEQSKALKLMVDHHPQPDAFADFEHHSVKACSTAELIYTLIELLGDHKLIDATIGDCLYTGIMTDTGSFRYPSVTEETHRVVAALIHAGANTSAIHERVYDNNTESRLRLLGFALHEKMVLLPDYHVGYISLTEAELDHFGYQKGDTEGLVNYILSLRGMKFATFIAERDGAVKMSFRSKGDFDVNSFARTHFGGGGHKNAAGGYSEKKLEEVIRQFRTILPTYLKELNKGK